MSIAVSCQTRAFCALQPGDEEAVDPDQLARPLRLDVPGRLRLARRLVRRPVARNERDPLQPRVQPVTTQAASDAVVRDDDSAPALPPKLARDPLRPVAGVTEREGNDPLLHQR